MANSDKNIVITPAIGSTTADPQIVFSGASSTLGPQNITLKAYSTSNGTLSFDASSGQLFSITNELTGSIFSVNDISGIPSIEVLSSGLVKIAQYSGNVTLGSTTATSSVDIANGFTISGATKTVNIGTGGGSGSITNVNIGSTLGTRTTTINGAANITGVATFSAGNAGAPAITTTGDPNTGIFFPVADSIAFTEGGVEVMRIESNGRVGIGTSAPDVKLQVTGGCIAGGYTTATNVVTTMNFSQLGNVIQKTTAVNQTITANVPPAGTICVLQIVKANTTSTVITFGSGFISAGTLTTGTDNTKVFNLLFASNGTNLIEVSRNGPI